MSGETSHGIIDTDTHIMEMPDLWTSRLPKKWGDQVLHVEWNDAKQRDMWYMEGTPLAATWGMASYGWRSTEDSRDEDDLDVLSAGPATQSQADPATYDIAQRVQLMDKWGVAMQVLYPNIAGFDWKPFVSHSSPEIAAAHISAYNDYQLEWVAAAPGRFIPMLVIPYWDVPRSVAEIERLAPMGFGGVVSSGAPQQHGQPYLMDRHWDPLWAACQDAGLSVSFHVASGDVTAAIDAGRLQLEGPLLNEARAPLQLHLENAKQITELLTSGVLARFPALHFVSVESGIGWVPFVLESLDRRFMSTAMWRFHPEFGDMLPSEFFRRQVSVNFWMERLNDLYIERIGLDSLLFETDFPHRTGVYFENFDDVLEMTFGNLPDEVRHTILWENPARLFRPALEAQGVAV